MNKGKQASELRDINTLIQAAVDYVSVAPEKNFSKISYQRIVANKILPIIGTVSDTDGCVSTGDEACALNQFGGVRYIEKNTSNGFTIVTTGLPSNIAVNIEKAFKNKTESTSITTITDSGDSVTLNFK